MDSARRAKNNSIDRLSSLPDEALIMILSLLPAKDVAATCALSKRLSRVLPWITSLDFDVSPLSLCVTNPYRIQDYPCFVTFVNSVLQSHQSQYLTKFRLRVGSVDFSTRYYLDCDAGQCEEPCLPDLTPSQVNPWITFPLSPPRFGLRELDLTIWMRDPSNCQLPPGIFTCETLVVLKLDTNLSLDQVYAMPSYRLPKLKLLRLYSSLISDDDFLTRLVSSSPLLEDLDVEAKRDRVHHTVIDNPSLRRLSLRFYLLGLREFDSCDYVHIHTPNLECFEYFDNLAYHYSFQEMPSLVKAHINFNADFQNEDREVSYNQLLSFIKHFSHARHLNLLGCFMEDLNRVEVKDQLPMFPNLNYLRVGRGSNKDSWDKVLLALLNCSPVLETLDFCEGLTMYYDPMEALNELQELELEFFRRAHAIPLCCRHHLKRIEIQRYLGLPREVEIIKFLLRHSLVLEELVIYRHVSPFYQSIIPDLVSMQRALNDLPRAAAACSIQVV